MSVPDRAPPEVTLLLSEWSSGDSEALEQLMPLVIDDLRRIARSFMAHEPAGHTLQATALVNEVYMKLAGRRSVTWKNREQFFAVMAKMMRRLLVDRARARKAAKRGGGAVKIPIDDAGTVADHRDPEILALDEALATLEEVDPRQAHIVELRYFCGLTIEETAEALGIGTTLVKEEQRLAKLWLLRELRD